MSDEPLCPPEQAASFHWFLVLLTLALVSGFMGVIGALFILHVPDGNRDTLLYMAGQLSGFTAAAVGLWVNTTFQSAKKTEIIAKAEPVKP